MIKENFLRLKDHIDRICRRLGKDPAGVVIVGVTKTCGVEGISEALAAGLTHIGENKVQEAAKKFCAITPSSAGVTRHMIGHLQTNKAGDALKVFDIIQSVDSLKLAYEIEKHAAKQGRVIDVLLQVNTSGEEQKFGTSPEGAKDLVARAGELTHLRVLGLMTIGPLTDDQAATRESFRKLKKLFDQFGQEFKGHPGINMKFLSMGMSDDYEIALEEGANMVRIGRAIFNEPMTYGEKRS